MDSLNNFFFKNCTRTLMTVKLTQLFPDDRRCEMGKWHGRRLCLWTQWSTGILDKAIYHGKFKSNSFRN